MYSAVAVVPDERLAVVVLTNGMMDVGDALAKRVIDAYLGVPTRDWSAEGLVRLRAHVAARTAIADSLRRARVSATKPSLPLEEYAGRYAGRVYGDATVTHEKNALVLRLLANPQLVADLTHLQLDTFALTWRHDFPWFGGGKAQFVLDNDARVTELKLDVPNEDFWFDEIDLRKQAR
jgi:hypothetical protein